MAYRYASSTGTGTGTGLIGDPYSITQINNNSGTWTTISAEPEKTLIMMDVMTAAGGFLLPNSAGGCIMEGTGTFGGVTCNLGGIIATTGSVIRPVGVMAGGFTVRGCTLTAALACVYAPTANYTGTGITIQNNVITCTGSTSFGIILESVTLTDYTISGNTINVGNQIGVGIDIRSLPTNGSIYNNTIRGTAGIPTGSTTYLGIAVASSGGQNLRIYGNTIDNLWYGAQLGGKNTYLYSNRITNCTAGKGYLVAGAGGIGVVLVTNAESNVIENNVFYNNYEHVNIAISGATTLGGNIVSTNKLSVCTVNSIKSTSTATNVSRVADKVVGNYIDHNPISGRIGGDANSGHGISIGGTAALLEAFYNFVSCGTVGTNIQAMLTTTGVGDVMTYSANIYYITNGANYGKLGLTNYTTFATWTAALATGTPNAIVVKSEMDNSQLNSSYKKAAIASGSGGGVTDIISRIIT